MVRNLTNISDPGEDKVLENLGNDIKNYKNKIEKSKRFGIYLPKEVSILQKNVYIYFSQLSKRKQLSDKTLEWMATFSENSPYEDIRKNYHTQEWVNQYRKLKENKCH